MHNFFEVLLSFVNRILSPIYQNPIFFFIYAFLLYVPEVFTVVAHDRIEYIGGSLFYNFVIYAVVSYILLALGYLFRFNRYKYLWSGYNFVLHILLYIYSIGDLFCIKVLSTRYTSTILSLIFQTNAQEVSGFFETYFFTKLFFTIILFYLFVGLIEIFICWVSWAKLYQFFHRWGGAFAIIYAIYVLRISLPYFGNDLDDLYKRIYWYAENEKIKKNTLWQLYMGIGSIKETQHQFLELLSAIEKNEERTICNLEKSCIILIIGESYNKSHSHLYGYSLQTTPKMEKLDPIVFSDVISPSNITNYAFRNFLSPVRTDDSLKWYQAPLFPYFFKKVNYNVVFCSNQFCYSSKEEATYNWRTTFYLNNPTINDACFSYRSTELFDYDMEMVENYASIRNKIETDEKDLIIFHLMGQHFNFKDRYPIQNEYYTSDSIKRDLSENLKQVVAAYDNSIRYNDSVVSSIVDLYKDKDAIVVYFSDHGEEVCDYRNSYGRTSDFEACNWGIMRNNLDVPFLVFASEIYKRNHPDIIDQLEAAKDKRFMTDDLSHILLYLGGIQTNWYQDNRNPLSGKYDNSRHRMVKQGYEGEVYSVDYDAH